MNPRSRESVGIEGVRYGRTLRALPGAVGAVVLSMWVTSLDAQSAGQLLAPPVVHELRLMIPPLSQATLSAATALTSGVWSSSVDAVTNVTIDVLLLPPDVLGPEALAVRIRDADGTLRTWVDGPILVARALTPGRHSFTVRWEADAMSDADLARATMGVQTFTRPALTGAGALLQASSARAAAASATGTAPQVLLRIAPY